MRTIVNIIAKCFMLILLYIVLSLRRIHNKKPSYINFTETSMQFSHIVIHIKKRVIKLSYQLNC